MTELLIFAREPVLGRVKTRLAADIGPEAALGTYRELLAHTAAAVAEAALPATLWLAEAPADAAPTRPEWPGLPWRVQPPAPDLGERMRHAFAEAFAAGAARALIIGTDCPGLTATLLRQAEAALATHDLVIGPADDGGYYLLGMSILHAEIFTGKPWSTSAVRAATLADAERLGLRVALLPLLHDVDTGADWQRWQAARAGHLTTCTPASAPAGPASAAPGALPPAPG